jgi:hypothetical protein
MSNSTKKNPAYSTPYRKEHESMRHFACYSKLADCSV